MIPPFTPAGALNPITFNGLTFNSPSDDPTNMTQFLGSHLSAIFNTVTNDHPNDDGSEVTPVYRSLYVLRLDGIMRGSTLPKLCDRVRDFTQAFDPALASQYDSTSTVGVLPLGFNYFTLDEIVTYTASQVLDAAGNVVGASVPSYYYGRARSAVVPPMSAFTGLAVPWTAELILPDPRRYLQSTTSISSDGGGTVTNPGDYPSWPTITIVTSGAGSATYTLTYNGSSTPLVLDLSSAAGTYVIDCAAKTITKGGVARPETWVSGDFPIILPGTKTLALANTTNATTTTVYRRAWCA